MGCYNDNSDLKDFTDYVYIPVENTNKICILECYNKNFSYAATQERYMIFFNLFFIKACLIKFKILKKLQLC